MATVATLKQAFMDKEGLSVQTRSKTRSKRNVADPEIKAETKGEEARTKQREEAKPLVNEYEAGLTHPPSMLLAIDPGETQS